MPKQIITDTFEQLGQTAGQVVQQIGQEPAKMAESASQQMGTIPASESQNGQEPKAAQIAQKKETARRALSHLEQELAELQQKKKQEMPKQVVGKPGAPKDDKEAIKQIELQEAKKKELPPMVVAAQSKASAEKRQFGGG